MKQGILSRVAKWSGTLGVVVALFIAVPAFADLNQHSQSGARGASEDDGAVLHSSLDALSDAVELTAAFNVGSRDVSTYPLHLPYQILYTPNDPTAVNNTGGTNTTFIVKRGTRIYVPVLFNDDAPASPPPGDFPPAGDRRALLNYFYSQAELGLVYARIVVDSKVASLRPNYLLEVDFPSVLPDGATRYQIIAAFLAPLEKGTHSVEIAALLTGSAVGGDYQFSTTYTVIVK
jgi:hypothetical protein